MVMPIWLMKTWGSVKLAGTWLKGHWFLIVLAAGILYLGLFAKNKSNMITNLVEELRKQQAENVRQLDQLRSIQRNQIEEQEKINEKYNEVLIKIQNEYQEQLRTLDIQKEIDLRHIIATNKDDPAAMAKDINILFGIPIYPVE